MSTHPSRKLSRCRCAPVRKRRDYHPDRRKSPWEGVHIQELIKIIMGSTYWPPVLTEPLLSLLLLSLLLLLLSLVLLSETGEGEGVGLDSGVEEVDEDGSEGGSESGDTDEVGGT